MNDSNFAHESFPDPQRNVDVSTDDNIPQFGALDIVEAFTAMRHEWRGQIKESLTLADQIQSAVTSIQSLESKLLASVAGKRSESTADSRPLVMLVIETDLQLSRAAAAIAQWEATCHQREVADTQEVEQQVSRMNGVARWLARPLLELLARQRSAQASSHQQPAVEGLNIVLARLRRMMHEQGIERLDVEGQPFDANIMYAIGIVESTTCPAGHVAEQFSPAYLWQGQVIRFADVRIAKEPELTGMQTTDGIITDQRIAGTEKE